MTRPGRLLAGLAAVPLALAVSATSDGSEETWIDPDPEAEGPAPGITLIAAGGDAHGGSTASPASSTVDDGEQAAPVTAAADDEGTDLLAIASLVVAAAALVVAGFAAWSARRA